MPVMAKALLLIGEQLQLKTKGFCAVIVGPNLYCACVIKYKNREHQSSPQLVFEWPGISYVCFSVGYTSFKISSCFISARENDLGYYHW